MTPPIPGYVKVTATPPEAIGGSAVKFSAAFFNAVTNAAADPAEVAFSFAADGASPTVYRYGTDAQLVKDAVGEYHVDVDTSNMAPVGDKAYLKGEYVGDANGTGSIQVTDYVTVLVMAPPMPDPFG